MPPKWFARLVVVSRSLDLDPAAAAFTDAPARPIVLTTTAASPARRAALEEVADVCNVGTAVVDLGAALQLLADRQLRCVLCEGGPRLLADVVAADLVDELCLTVSPVATAGGQLGSGAGLAPRNLMPAHVLIDEMAGMVFLRHQRGGPHDPLVQVARRLAESLYPDPRANPRPVSPRDLYTPEQLSGFPQHCDGCPGPAGRNGGPPPYTTSKGFRQAGPGRARSGGPPQRPMAAPQSARSGRPASATQPLRPGHHTHHRR